MSDESPHSPEPQVNANHHGTRPSRVVVRAPNWVGDAVMAIPALRELRRIFTASRITIASRSWVEGLFEGEGLADDFLAVEDARGIMGLSRLFSEAGGLRRGKFDLAVLLTNSFGTALAARAGGVKRLCGYATDARRVLLDQTVPFERHHKSLHQVRYYLNIAAHLETWLTGGSTVDIQNSEPRLTATDEHRVSAKVLFERFNVASAAGRSPILAINPGATNSTAKRWLAERFAGAADRLSELQGFQTVIVGTTGDKPIAEEVARQMKTPATVLAGQTSIAQLKGVLAAASLVISNDTGTSHVSAALGVPTVVVFGPTEHISTRPFSLRAAVVRHDVECSPCMLRECPIDHRCMTRVEVDDVLIAAKNLLVGSGSS